MRNPFQLDFWSIFGPLRPLRNTAHGSKFEGFQVCTPRLKKDPKSRPGGPHFRVFSTFLFVFWPFREAKNPGSAIFAIFERMFLQENLQCEKKRKKKRKSAQVGAMRGAGGRGGRVALACKTLQVFAGVCAGVCMQAFVRHLTRRQGCGGFKRSAHSAVPTWWLGCLECWRIGGEFC